MSYARSISYLVLAGSLCFGGLFNNSTIYSSASMATPYINDVLNVEDDYKYTFGIRKIALFPYQVKSNFYKGDEKQLSDNALFGAVDGLEYLFQRVLYVTKAMSSLTKNIGLNGQIINS